jgi:hypothetical protein
LAVLELNPRGEIAHVPLLKRATWTPSARSSASASVVTPARRMSSPVMTEMAAAVVPIGCGRRAVEVTSICNSSSMERRFRSPCAAAGSVDAHSRAVASSAVREAISSGSVLARGRDLARL